MLGLKNFKLSSAEQNTDRGQNDQDVEVLNKPIQSGTSGEVFIQRADAQRNCIDGGDLVPSTSTIWNWKGSARACRDGRPLNSSSFLMFLMESS